MDIRPRYIVEACIEPGVRKWVSVLDAESPSAAIEESRRFHKGKRYVHFRAFNFNETSLGLEFAESHKAGAVES